MPADRVMVFIDYQNTYMAARTEFAGPADEFDYVFGQISPRAVGDLIVARRSGHHQSELAGVRVYRGQPSASKDPRGYGASRAQVDAWRRQDGVVAVTRPLRYPIGYPDHSPRGEKPMEKGIDVELAVDMVTMAVENRYDVAVLFSLDTDLKPPLEFVVRRSHAGGPRAEAAAWSGPNRKSRRLAISGTNLWCHWLDRDDFDSVADATDYVRR